MEMRLNSNLLKESFLSDFFKEKLNDNNFQDFDTRFWKEFDFEGLWSEPQNRKSLSQTPANKFL